MSSLPHPEEALSGIDPWADFECRAVPPDPSRCANPLELGRDYVYLLGLYLGDGCLSKAPKGVWRLRIFQDQRYTELVQTGSRTIKAVVGRPAGRIQTDGCVEVYSFWKHWICLFPQHGPGRKHSRSMALRGWQELLVRLHPRDLLRGLIHSDGARCINRIRRSTRDGERTYEYVRYFFSNHSPDILRLFTDTCAVIGVDTRPDGPYAISVARRKSVALLDSFIGPKR